MPPPRTRSEFGDARRYAVDLDLIHFTKASWAPRVQLFLDSLGDGDLQGHPLLPQENPQAPAFWTFSQPFDGCVAAFLTDVLGYGFSHGQAPLVRDWYAERRSSFPYPFPSRDLRGKKENKIAGGLPAS